MLLERADLAVAGAMGVGRSGSGDDVSWRGGSCWYSPSSVCSHNVASEAATRGHVRVRVGMWRLQRDGRAVWLMSRRSRPTAAKVVILGSSVVGNEQSGTHLSPRCV